MAQYKQSEITNVFWASNDGFKGGRDPLGIQNSSIATYSKLLPGLTNLTRHIRYYSLYCWLLSEYDKLEVAGQISLHQYNFIRRAELAMALIMKEQNVGSVVGALFVSQGRYKQIEDGIYDIADGADYESKDKYWTFKSGAFGQYYLGSLIYYELVKIEEGRFYLRNKGKELADAVRNSIDENIRKLFLKCILDGSLKEEAIEDLQSLAIHRINVGSEEWLFLNNLLTKSDEDSSLRRETIFLLLNDISNGIEIQEFVKNRFLHINEDGNLQAAFGWYFYYLCEGLHYCIDLFFCLILYKIHELHNNINIIYDELRNFVSKQDYISAAVHAIRLMLRLYTEFENNTKNIEGFEGKNDLKHQRGILSEGLRSYVERYLSFSISGFIESLIVQIMQEHTVVAIAKMGKNNSDLRKFILEDGRIVLIEQRYPVETSPRIDSLFNFLQDMGYLDKDNTLTEIAEQFIENYGKE